MFVLDYIEENVLYYTVLKYNYLQEYIKVGLLY